MRIIRHVNTRSITVNIPHRLTQDEARTRLQNGIADLRTQHAGKIANVQDTWTGNHMDLKLGAMGQTTTGRIDVEQHSVCVEVDLPWLLAMLADRIKPQIEQEGRKMLEKKP